MQRRGLLMGVRVRGLTVLGWACPINSHWGTGGTGAREAAVLAHDPEHAAAPVPITGVGRRPVVRTGLRASRSRSIRSEGHMLNPQRQLDKQLEAHQPGVRKQGAGGPHRAKCHPLVTLRSPP